MWASLSGVGDTNVVPVAGTPRLSVLNTVANAHMLQEGCLTPFLKAVERTYGHQLM